MSIILEEAAGLLHSRESFLACQGMQSFVELIATLPSSMGEIGSPVASQQAPGRVVEHRQDVGSLPHAQLRMILAHGGIASIMQAMLNAKVASAQLQEAVGISECGRQTGDAVAHLLLGSSQGIGALAVQLEDVCRLRPLAVVGQQATHRDRAFLQPPMAFLHRLGLPKIHRGSRAPRPAHHRLKERLDLVIKVALLGFDHPQVIPMRLHNLQAEVPMSKQGVSAHHDPP